MHSNKNLKPERALKSCDFFTLKLAIQYDYNFHIYYKSSIILSDNISIGKVNRSDKITKKKDGH